MNNGTLCMFEAARRRLAAPKPSVDHLQLSQHGMSRRLLNPRLYELHDDASETLWPTDDGAEQVSSTAENTGKLELDTVVSDKVDELELNRQSLSDQEDIWSDCAAELCLCKDNELAHSDAIRDRSISEHSDCCAVHKNELCRSGSESAGKTEESCEIDANCHNVESNGSGVEPVTTCDLSRSSPTNHASAAPCEITTPDTTTTTSDKPTAAATTKPSSSSKITSTASSKTTSTTACTTSSTSTTSSSKSERPRASPCRAASQTKQTAPVTNGKESKPPCKAPSPAASAKQSPLSNAAAAKLLVDMVGRSKSASSAAAGGGGQCKLTQCADKAPSQSEPASNVNVSTDGGSCTSEKTSRNTGGSTGDKKDGGKFCECWHCEFFGHMSVSYRRLLSSL